MTTINAQTDDYCGGESPQNYEQNLSRARVAGYVLLAGLLLEVVAGLIWFHGAETLASIIAMALVAGGVAGELFFESRARLTDKAAVCAIATAKIQGFKPSRDAAHLSHGSRPNNFKPSSQYPHRERRKLPARCGRGRVAA